MVEDQSQNLKYLEEIQDKDPLTDLDLAVVERYLRPISNKEIAEELNLSVNKVRSILLKPNVQYYCTAFSKRKSDMLNNEMLSLLSLGLEKRKEKILELYNSEDLSDTEMADMLLFGRSSLLDIQDTLAKQKKSEMNDRPSSSNQLILNFLNGKT